MPPQRREPRFHGGLYPDLLFAYVAAYLVFFAPYLIGMLMLAGGLLWLVSEGGYLWAERPAGDLPATLLLLASGSIALCLGFACKSYCQARTFLQDLGSRSLRTSGPFRNCEDLEVLSRFVHAPACGIARGHITRKGLSTAACTVTSATGLLLTVFNRVHVIDWRDIERLLPSANDAGIVLTDGALAGEEITIPWSRDLEAGVPARLRQQEAVSSLIASDPNLADAGDDRTTVRRNYRDIVIEGAVVGTIGTMLFLLVLFAVFWLVFGILLGQDFATMTERDMFPAWLISFLVLSIWLPAMYGPGRDLIAFLRWLESRALRSADRTQPVDSDEFRRRFVGEAILGRAAGLLVRYGTQVPGEALVFNSGLLLVTSRRAYLLAWHDIERVLPGTDRATLVLSGPAGIPDHLSVPFNKQMAEVVPRVLLPVPGQHCVSTQKKIEGGHDEKF